MRQVLLDQGSSAYAAEILRGDGWDAVHIAEMGMYGADDVDILDAAGDSNRIASRSTTTFTRTLQLRSGLPP